MRRCASEDVDPGEEAFFLGKGQAQARGRGLVRLSDFQTRYFYTCPAARAAPRLAFFFSLIVIHRPHAHAQRATGFIRGPAQSGVPSLAAATPLARASAVP
jgi:hypothetical protein